MDEMRMEWRGSSSKSRHKQELATRYLIEQYFRCHYCLGDLNEVDATLDHIAPRSHGNYSYEHNAVACCKSCNGAKGDMSYSFFMELINSSLPPLIVKNRRNFGFNGPGKKRGGTQQARITKAWLSRRSRIAMGYSMPSAEELNLRIYGPASYVTPEQQSSPTSNNTGESPLPTQPDCD